MKTSAFNSDSSFARDRDAADELARFRAEFELPRRPDGSPVHYLCGHSLGLMPHAARRLIQREIERWSQHGVDGHFASDDGWFSFHERFAAPLARLVGAAPREIVAMNSLTVNLHLMLASFFRPQGNRRKVLIEQGAFPSDRYAVQSQLAFHGLDPADDLVELAPASGDLSAAALDAALQTAGETVALVLLPGVQYLTGEAIDFAACAAIARQHGCRIGFDLAHAIGNLEIDLTTADPDFAVWCSYKYLNGGPGAIGGCYVNHRHFNDDKLPRLEGWWGHDKRNRFDTQARFTPIDSAEAWQLSNPPILAMAALEASLALFDAAKLQPLRTKSIALTAYLETLLDEYCGDQIELLTPADPARRGAQLSVRLPRSAQQTAAVVRMLREAGVTADSRPPDVIRLAPVPLYNSFTDVQATAAALATALRG
jgi:kynureninase